MPQKRPSCHSCGWTMTLVHNAEKAIIPKPGQTMYAAANEQGYGFARRHNVWKEERQYFYRCDNPQCPNYKPSNKPVFIIGARRVGFSLMEGRI